MRSTKPNKPWREFGRYGSVGIELVLSIIVGYYAGHWVDERIGGGRGWITAAGFLIGVYAGFRAIFSVAKHLERDIERAEKQERGEDPWKKDDDTSTSPTPDASDFPVLDASKRTKRDDNGSNEPRT